MRDPTVFLVVASLPLSFSVIARFKGAMSRPAHVHPKKQYQVALTKNGCTGVDVTAAIVVRNSCAAKLESDE